jgi:hypothetical protein
VFQQDIWFTYYRRKVIGEWGVRKWMPADAQTVQKRTNVHIIEVLRLALLEQLGGHTIKYNGDTVAVRNKKGEAVDLTF